MDLRTRSDAEAPRSGGQFLRCFRKEQYHIPTPVYKCPHPFRKNLLLPLIWIPDFLRHPLWHNNLPHGLFLKTPHRNLPQIPYLNQRFPLLYASDPQSPGWMRYDLQYPSRSPPDIFPILICHIHTDLLTAPLPYCLRALSAQSNNSGDPG